MGSHGEIEADVSAVAGSSETRRRIERAMASYGEKIAAEI
jgi:hypothetical protein